MVAQQGGEITSAELSSLVGLLLLAGFETTVNAIGNGVRALLANHEQWQLLVQDPSRAAAVVEEVLRYDPPVQQTARVLLSSSDPVELSGVPVRRGQWVVLMLAAANRDPAVFIEPDRFDITRANAADHLAFSERDSLLPGRGVGQDGTGSRVPGARHPLPEVAGIGAGEDAPGTTLRGPRRLPVAI